MANNLQRQITLDGWRNVFVKFVGVLDSSDANIAPALALSDLRNNDPSGVLSGLRVDSVAWSVNGDLTAILEWQAATPQLIVALTDSQRIKANKAGGFLPDQTASGYTGALNLRTTGYPGGRTVAYTLAVNLVKLYR